jgi:hypothetical protein
MRQQTYQDLENLKPNKMQNQFFYTRKELKSGTPENPVYNEFKDSFNIEKVIRTLSIEDGRTLVLLDDLHERAQDVPDVDAKTGRTKGLKRQRNMFQSEIYLEAEDAKRFFEITSIG